MIQVIISPLVYQHHKAIKKKKKVKIWLVLMRADSHLRT